MLTCGCLLVEEEKVVSLLTWIKIGLWILTFRKKVSVDCIRNSFHIIHPYPCLSIKKGKDMLRINDLKYSNVNDPQMINESKLLDIVARRLDDEIQIVAVIEDKSAFWSGTKEMVVKWHDYSDEIWFDSDKKLALIESAYRDMLVKV